MSYQLQSITLTSDEIRAITGAIAPSVQLNELRRLGFTRARRGMDRSLILERAHYEAVCAGAIVLAPGKLPKAAEAITRRPRAMVPAQIVATPPPTASSPPAAVPQPAPTPDAVQPIAAKGRAKAPKISLGEWAKLNYSVPISNGVLSKWRREGQIYPPAERVGRTWLLPPDAKRLADGQPYGYKTLVERLIESGQ